MCIVCVCVCVCVRAACAFAKQFCERAARSAGGDIFGTDIDWSVEDVDYTKMQKWTNRDRAEAERCAGLKKRRIPCVILTGFRT